MIEQWFLILWITSRQLALTLSSYDTESQCRAAAAQVESESSVEVTCARVVAKKKVKRRK